MSKGDDDSSLLARLNALRPSNVDLDKKEDAPKHDGDKGEGDDSDDDLARRFLGLRARSSEPEVSSATASETAPNEGIDEVEDIDDMLKEFRAKQKFSLAENDEQRIKLLLAEAGFTLDNTRETKDAGEVDAAGKPFTTFQDTKETETTENDEELEADDILAQILDEVKLEQSGAETGIGDGGETDRSVQASQHDDNEEPSKPRDGDLVLPSTPSKDPLPLPPSRSSSDGGGLSLPAAPTSAPTARKKPADGSSLRNYTDAEIETWCEICQANAEVRCLGCDGDLYCMRCWKEGHTGPDVGYEERQHRCVQYSKPGRPEAAAA